MNLKKLLILTYKDFLVLLNDKAGLGYMFVLPVFLVFIMVVIQDSSFKAVNDFNINIVVQNNDNDTLGNTIVRELKESGYFTIALDSQNHKTEIKNLVAKGEYKIGIIIPEKSTHKLKKEILKNVSNAFSSRKPAKTSKSDSVQIEIFFDPVTRTSYKRMIMSMLESHQQKVQNQLIMTQINRRIPFIKSDIEVHDIVTYKESYASIEGARIIPNSVQHNVPAWTLFAMFFIVMSLAGNMIKEKDDGSFVRLTYAPFPFFFYLIAKLITYLLIGLLQFMLMILMGIYILPWFEFPALDIGNKFLSLFIIGFIASLAAVGFGILVGSFAKTYQQSTTLGSIIVVILAAIGGVWVPVFAMPAFMRTISIISPLNWGVKAFHNTLVRDLPYTASITEITLLLLFFIACMIISSIRIKFKDH
jgi:ABC-2 type transport system permease protein